MKQSRLDQPGSDVRQSESIVGEAMTIFEVAVSAVVLGAVVTTAAQLVQWSVTLHQVALKKRCALEAATSVLDRISARPWSAITADSVKNISLPPEAKEFLADARLSVDGVGRSRAAARQENRGRNQLGRTGGHPHSARAIDAPGSFSQEPSK